MSLRLFVLALSLLSLCPSLSSAFWIVGHSPLQFSARLDPIVNPGAISSHVHTFVGSSAISASQDYNSLRDAASCTTAPVQADKSSYWTPTLYKYDGKSFTAFDLTAVNTYYLQRGPSNAKLSAFPAGLRMLAGDNSARGPAATKQLQSAVSFVCLNYASGSKQTQTMPTGACPQGLRAQIVFPSCWDGKNLDSADHKSHMSYPLGDNADNGNACPASHPVRFPVLFYEFIWSVGSEAANGNWVFSNGDTEGYAFHGDFMNGWDVDVLQKAIDTCTGQLFGDLESCAPFKPTIDRKKASACKVTPSNVKGLQAENVAGPMNSLPGCMKIMNGRWAGKGGCGSSSSTSSSSSGTGGAGSSSNPPPSALAGSSGANASKATPPPTNADQNKGSGSTGKTLTVFRTKTVTVTVTKKTSSTPAPSKSKKLKKIKHRRGAGAVFEKAAGLLS